MPKLRIRNFLYLPLVALARRRGCAANAPAVTVIAPPPAPAATVVTFTDITKEAGIDFVHNNGAFGAKLLPETMGSGVGFIDYDGDGFQDIILINSRDWTAAEIAAYKTGTGKDLASSIPAQPAPKGGTCKLYHNNGNGIFTDVTKGSGLDVPMFGMGVSVADYDNDGRSDIYITAVGRNYLFHNEGAGSIVFSHKVGTGVAGHAPKSYVEKAVSVPRFKDVSEQGGVKDGGWSTSSAW